MKKMILALMLSLAAAAVVNGQTNKPLLVRNPTLSRTHIAFSYAGDLWTVSREGGEAQRLTTGTGNEALPAVFSRRPVDSLHGRV